MSEAAAAISLKLGRLPEWSIAFLEEGALPALAEPALFLVTRASALSPALAPQNALLLQACEALRRQLWDSGGLPDWMLLSRDPAIIARELTCKLPRVLFYDPDLEGRDGEHLWTLLERIDTAIALLKCIASPDAGAGFEAAQSRAQGIDSKHRRQRCLQHGVWLNAAEVGARLGVKGSNVHAVTHAIGRLRHRGELLGARSGKQFLHPSFQFRGDRLIPEIKALLDVLPEDRSGWRQVLWLFEPHVRLSGACPVDLSTCELSQAVDLAREDFSASRDAAASIVRA